MSKKLFTNFSAVNWEYINWSITRNYVSRLQQRIYIAAFKQDYAKMKYLQEKLLFSYHSKLLSVFIVLQNSTISHSKHYNITNYDKLMLANCLNLNQNPYRAYIINFTHLQTQQRHQQLLCTILKQTRQCLAELALKPEWNGKCIRNLQESTISNYSKKRKILKILKSIYDSQYSYTLVLDLAMYIIYGNYTGIINKLYISSSAFLQQEMKIWLEKQNLVAFKGRKSSYDNLSSYMAIKNNSLPINIVVSTLINQLSNWLVEQKLYSGVKYFVNNSQIIFLCRNLLSQQNLALYIKFWFTSINADMRLIQFSLSNTINGFECIGYKIQKKNQRIAITVSKKSQILLWEELSKTIQKSNGLSAYQLIQKLSPRIAFWGNYFKYTKCLKVFSRLDYLLHLRLWTWALRRHPTINKNYIKHKYFPEGKQYIYRKRLVKSNWIFYGYDTDTRISKECFLIRFLWFKYLQE
uniref:Group II intron maturase-specific domain-containing protein n=1 Tax=Hildenbrandia rubra TaxID=31481 RepID=A0A1C9CFX1_9FLOR|nr:hypothetical protein Hrub_013 [Hildenbrandia rubra]AOM67257.1 hypothetical protein Hrub_013 [Hildenbrandia rubra]